MAKAEQAPMQDPMLMLHVQPSLSLSLPGAGSSAVTDVYGFAHPTGSVGFSYHPIRRLGLLFELEFQGWRGDFPATEPINTLSFLNYFVHIKPRISIAGSQRVQFQIDAILGLVIGREDGERFRAEGRGISVGAGPVMFARLGRFIGLSLSASFELGWVWYDIESPQTMTEQSSYRLFWPRFTLGLALHAILSQKIPQEVEVSAVPEQDSDPDQPQEDLPSPF